MARISGVDLPRNKRGSISLTYIYGIGRSLAVQILEKAGVDPNVKVQDWTDDNVRFITKLLQDEYKVEGQLRSEIQLNIKRLMDIGCYNTIQKVFQLVNFIHLGNRSNFQINIKSWLSERLRLKNVK